MSDNSPLTVVLCWHMHQPEYRDLVSRDHQLPWTYLHAIKDYVDMAAHLEAAPRARAVVNFAPLLLEQIADYAREVDGFLNNGLAIRDPLLAALAKPALPSDAQERLALVKGCLQANERQQIARFPAYKRLADISSWLTAHPENAHYLAEQYLADLLAWFHLAWLGETVRRADRRVQRLMDKGSGFTLHDRRELLGVIGDLLSGVIERYRRLVERGQVELSVTPYAHPILPLLLDFASAREATPDVKLPLLAHYPGGEERARWHVERGIEVFEAHFGFRPAGCWPAEGSLSEPTLRLLSEAGFSWTASGQGVLANSLPRSGQVVRADDNAWRYQAYRIGHMPITCFFRDDNLSDLISFSYAAWQGDDAVADLVHRLEAIAEGTQGRPDSVAVIIMDGENAWDRYPANAYRFLSGLYGRLTTHPRLELTTFSEYLRTHAAQSLSTLVAGSWVYGTFSAWIGDAEKNRGWEMLGDAKHAFDGAAGRLSAQARTAAEQQLAICEGSDWFWWLGDNNPPAVVSNFERLYRLHLSNLYQLLGVEPPEYLAHVFAHGGGYAAAQVMRPGQPASG